MKPKLITIKDLLLVTDYPLTLHYMVFEQTSIRKIYLGTLYTVENTKYEDYCIKSIQFIDQLQLQVEILI